MSGVEVVAPKWANYLAADPDGVWYWFEKEPSPFEDGYRSEHCWQVDGGKFGRVFRAPPPWRDSLHQRPSLIASTPDGIKKTLMANAAARYNTARGCVVHVFNGMLLGVMKSSSGLEWVKTKDSDYYEILDTPESEYLRFKGDVCAPYWRALPCSDKGMFDDAEYVILRLPRNGVDGSKSMYRESSFLRHRDWISHPLNPKLEWCMAGYYKRHPEASPDSRFEREADLRIQEITWGGEGI